MHTTLNQLKFLTRFSHRIRIKNFWGSQAPTSAEGIFLQYAFFFGILFILTVPPFFGFDETTHFRAVQYWTSPSRTVEGGGEIRPVLVDEDVERALVSAGSDITTSSGRGDFSPRSYYSLYFSSTSGDKVIADLSGASVYSPISYAHMIIVTALAKLLHLPLLVQLYLMRLANLAVYMILIYFAVKFMPGYKMAIAFISLLPMALFQASTVNIDSVAIGSVFLVFAFITKLVFDPEYKLSKSFFSILLALNILLIMSKAVYLPVLFGYALVSVKKFGGLSKKLMGVMALTLGPILAYSLWYVNISVFADKLASVYRPGFYVNSEAQLAYILSGPMKFLGAVHTTIVNSGGDLYSGLIGVFDVNFYYLPVFLTLPAAIILVLLVISEDKLNKNKMYSLYMVSALMMSIMLIFTTFYLTYTPVGSVLVDGLQGRYFLPLLILVIPLIGMLRIATVGGISTNILKLSVVTLLSYSVITILLQSYYIYNYLNMLQKSFFKYLTAGIASFIFDFAVFWLNLNIFTAPLYVAASAGYFCGFILSFTLNKYWVYESSSNKSAPKQVLFYVILLVFNYFSTILIVLFLSNAGIDPSIAKILSMFLIVIWNYLIFSKFIFGAK